MGTRRILFLVQSEGLLIKTCNESSITRILSIRLGPYVFFFVIFDVLMRECFEQIGKSGMAVKDYEDGVTPSTSHSTAMITRA